MLPPSRKWERADKRFDLAKEPNEANRFGWVVEVDPFDAGVRPASTPRLGRFKHEGANIHVADDGNVVAYMGDDERFDYLYKFVSSRKMMDGRSQAALRHNLTLLDSGTLYVAKFSGNSAAEIDGIGQAADRRRVRRHRRVDPAGAHRRGRPGESLVDGMTADEVPVFTRLAGDKVGATKMDRPEDVEPSPTTGKVYAALTNNTNRGVGGNAGGRRGQPAQQQQARAHPRDSPRTTPTTRTTFTWRLPLVCGDPTDADTYFGGYDKTKVSPDLLPRQRGVRPRRQPVDLHRRQRAGQSNDGLFASPLEGPKRGHLKQFLTVPHGAETCGPIVADDDVTCSSRCSTRVRSPAPAPTTRRRTGPTAATRSRVPPSWRCGSRAAGSASDPR